jgi:oligopeptide transport system substrate-binding protein
MKKSLSIALSILLLATVFVSCGGDKEAEAPATTVEKVAETPKAEEKAAPVVEEKAPVVEEKAAVVEAPAEDEGVVFTISNGAEPASLDPALIQGVPEHRIYMAMFEGLVTSDPKTANAVPGLATSWEASEDGTQYTFHLRKTTWSDGTPITAHDVVYSWLRELNPDTAADYAWFPSMFLAGAAEYNSGEVGPEAVGIRALDDYTFQMDLIGPIPYAVDALEHYSFAVVPQHAIEEFGEKWTAPENIVSNGPFLLKERVPQSYLSFVPNEKYWDRDAIKIDKLVILSSDDENTNYNMFTNGEIDWITNVPTDKLASAQMKDSYQANAQLATYYYIFQMNKAPLDNLLVRKAISYAIDREELVEGVTKAGQIPAWGIVPPMAGYDALEFPFDSEEEATEMAQEFLAEAGYPNGTGFPTLEILYNTSEGHKQIAEYVQQQLLTKLGINVELVNEEWGTFLDDRSSGNFEIGRAGWVGDYQDPNTFLDMFMTGAAMNGGQYANDVYDTLLKEAATISDPVDRFGVLKTAEDIMVNEDCSIMPFYYYITINMIDTNKWGGWYQNTMDYHTFKGIYLK